MRLVGFFGYAAEEIARRLKREGWTVAVSPQGFFVKGKKGHWKRENWSVPLVGQEKCESNC